MEWHWKHSRLTQRLHFFHMRWIRSHDSVNSISTGTCVNIYFCDSKKKFREILTWLFLFPVWSIFRGTVRDQGILRDFRDYPSGFSWIHRSDFVQRIQTYHWRMKRRAKWPFLICFDSCLLTNKLWKFLVPLPHLFTRVLQCKHKWKRKKSSLSFFDIKYFDRKSLPIFGFESCIKTVEIGKAHR